MPTKKSLQKKIEKKLDQLKEILDEIHEAQIINPDDLDTWDSDALYNLVAELKKALKLLEDQESKTHRDEFGNPLILEEGLCTLMDSYFDEDEDF